MEPDTSEKRTDNRTTNKYAKVYLFAYNVLQAAGWCFLLCLLIVHYIKWRYDTVWDTVKIVVITFQTAALLEILHAAVGIVRSDVVLTALQVFSRLVVVAAVAFAPPSGLFSAGLGAALFAWSLAEILRYLYYALNIVNVVPSVLSWLRYTAFIVLYPLGVSGELVCLYVAQQYVANHVKWGTIDVPNVLNISFSIHYIIIFIMYMYFPIFPQLYMHMFEQRDKVLGNGGFLTLILHGQPDVDEQ